MAHFVTEITGRNTLIVLTIHRHEEPQGLRGQQNWRMEHREIHFWCNTVEERFKMRAIEQRFRTRVIE